LTELLGERVGSLLERKGRSGRWRIAESGQVRSEDEAIGRQLIDDLPPDSATGTDAVQEDQRLSVSDRVQRDRH